jgi:hypothetical protein
VKQPRLPATGSPHTASIFNPATGIVAQRNPGKICTGTVQPPPVYRPNQSVVKQPRLPTTGSLHTASIFSPATGIVAQRNPGKIRTGSVQPPSVYRPYDRGVTRAEAPVYNVPISNPVAETAAQIKKTGILKHSHQTVCKSFPAVAQRKTRNVIQRAFYQDIDALLNAVVTANNTATGNNGVTPNMDDFSASVWILFDEAEPYLSDVNVQIDNNISRPAQATQTPLGTYVLKYKDIYPDQEYLIASILHELMHVTVEEHYDKAGLPATFSINYNLPHGMNVGNQLDQFLDDQEDILDENLNDAEAVVKQDTSLTTPMKTHVLGRLNYAIGQKDVHYDTVLGDILVYMELKGASSSPTFRFIRRLSEEARDRRTRQPLFGIPREFVRRVKKDAYWFQFWEW